MNRILAALLTLSLVAGATLPALAYTAEQQQELQIGQQVYQQLAQKGEIIQNSPYYRILDPIAARISRIADPQYFVPFRFILVHESQPNAFAVPGGNVFVTDSMMRFVQNKEELAGVLCHETSHDIHNDVINNMRKDQNLAIGATLLSILLGGGRSPLANTAINLAANLQALTYSRAVEHNADHKGAITCAQAGLNPWGMVWLMKAFEAHPSPNPPEFLSDHPTDSHRIEDLEAEFRSDPALFAKFNPDICSATPITADGFRNPYGRGCSQSRRQSSVRSTYHRSATSCPPGWKFCRRH